MLSWEYPPKITGGLGMACAGIAEALGAMGHQVDVLLPRIFDKHKGTKNVNLLAADTVELKPREWMEEVEVVKELKEMKFGSVLLPYLPAYFFKEEVTTYVKTKEKQKRVEDVAMEEVSLSGEYTSAIFGETHKYALIAAEIASKNTYDLVHVHDWVTFKAGQLIQKLSPAPVFFHVHSIESDRNGLSGNPAVGAIEQEALAKAKYVLSVSDRLKQSMSEQYGLDDSKVEVIPNGIKAKFNPFNNGTLKQRVGYVGRLTHQKGPNHFLDIVQDLRNRFPAMQFDMIGDGYLLPELKKKVNHLNLGKRVKFHGFLAPGKIKRAMQKLDLLVVPSNSEPFGLVILEALAYGVPVLTSPNTGIAQFIPSLPQIPNWDTFQYTHVIADLLSDGAKRKEILEKCQQEAAGLTWKNTADRINFLYQGTLGNL